MAFNLLPIENPCLDQDSGVSAILFIEQAKVKDLIFDPANKVVNIVLFSGATFKRFTFEEEVATFRQTETRRQGWPEVKQVLTLDHKGISEDSLRGIARLIKHGGVHIIVETRSEQVFYMGISYFEERGHEWESVNCVVTGGRASIEPEASQNILSTTIEATVQTYAPLVDVNLSTLPITEPPPPPVIPDTTAPVAILFTPNDDSTGVALSPTVSIVFNEVVVAGTGNLEIRDYATDTIVFQVDLANPAGVQFDQASASLTVLSPISLSYGEHYYVTVPATGVKDVAGNFFAGVSDKNAWDFYTGTAPDTTPPTLVSLTPPDNSTGVTILGLTASVQLNESVAAGVGVFYLYDHDTDALVNAYDVTLATVAGDTVTIDISADVQENKHYYFLFGSGVITDLAGNAFAGLTVKGDWDFQTNDSTAPVPTAYSPGAGSNLNSINSAIYMDVSEEVFKGTGTIYLVELVNGSGIPAQGGIDIVTHSWDVATSPDIVLSNGGTRINFNGASMDYIKFYHVIIPATAFVDGAGNQLASHDLPAQGGTYYWFWLTAQQLTLNLNPAPGGTLNCANNPILDTGFARAWSIRKSWVKVFDYNTDELITWLDFSEGVDIIGGFTSLSGGQNWDKSNGDQLFLTNLPVPPGSHIYVIMEPGAVYDPLHGTDLTVPTAKNDWHFEYGASAAITLASTEPAHNGLFSVNDAGAGGYISLTITWSGQVGKTENYTGFNDKFLYLYDYDLGTLAVKMNIGNNRNIFPASSSSNNFGTSQWTVILPETALDDTKRYAVVVDVDSFATRCGAGSAELAYGSWIIVGANYVPGASDGFDAGFNTGFQ